MVGEFDILVLGGGPAGAAAAIGLARVGHRVAVVASPRPFDACEGFSERTVEGLRRAGCAAAVARLGDPALRQAAWNGITVEANRETLVDRHAFDAALAEDMAAAGVSVVAGRAGAVTERAGGWHVAVRCSDGASAELSAGFLIEARGRAAPAAGARRHAGPATTAVLRCFQGPPAAPGSAVVPFAAGWAWMARLADGRRYVQFAVSSEAVPNRAGLAAYFDALLDELPEAAAWRDGAQAAGPVAARSAGPVLHPAPVGPRRLRIGDAALAVDPLSGNGLFQALSTGLMTVAVVNTLLRRPEDASLAASFYEERTRESFWRFARLGRDFYRQESRWAEAPFWAERRAWPDDRPAHLAPTAGEMKIVARPVVADGFVTARDVVVTPDQPLGIWKLDGVELAPLIRALHEPPADAHETVKARIARLTGAAPRQVETIAAWLWHRTGARS